MKYKNFLLILTSVLLISGCDFFGGIINGTSQNGSINSESSDKNDKPLDSSNDITDDDKIYEKDAYKNISFKDPNFSNRKIASKDDVTFDDLFNLGNKVSISVDISDKQLALLQSDYESGYKSEIYRIADKVDITLTNYGNTYSWSFDQVGIRQKGNTSREEIFKDGNIINLNHFKLSFDETFDNQEMYGKDAIDWTDKEVLKRERENRDFLGLSGIDIKWNKNYDSTHIKEIYASYLYDAAGLMAPSVGLTEFSIKQVDNNKTYDFGLCTLFEPASKSFIKRELKKGSYLNTKNWEDEKVGTYGVTDSKYGDFYKASYGVGEGFHGNGADMSSSSTSGKKVGVGNISGSYIPAYERKTNTDVSYSDSPLKNLTKAISSSSYSAIEKLMDLEYFAVTEACNYFIGNPDDLKNNHNNYTIYFRRTDGKAIIIPIDNDRCFGIAKDWNPDGHGMTEVGVFSTKPAARDRMNDLHKKTILASSNDCKAIYLNYVKALKVSTWLTNDTFKSLYDIAYQTYGNESCLTSFGDGFNFNINGCNDNWSFNDYITKKKNMVNLDQVINNASGGSTGNDNQNSSSETPNDGDYGNIYLIGSFMGWEKYNKNYPLEYKGNGVYTVTFVAQNSENGVIKYKFYDGEEYKNIDWTVIDDKLSMEVGSSAKLNANNGDEVTITINTLTMEVEVTVVAKQ